MLKYRVFFLQYIAKYLTSVQSKLRIFLYEPSCFYRFCLVFIYKRMALRELEIFKWVCFLRRMTCFHYFIWRHWNDRYAYWMNRVKLNSFLLFTNVDPFLCYTWVPLYLYFDSSYCLTIQAVALNSSGSNGMLGFQIGLLLDLWEAFLSKR